MRCPRKGGRIIFPVIVLGVFGWLVSRHYEKLYAPNDYNSDDAFLKALQAGTEGRPGLKELDNQIEQKVKSVLNSEDLLDKTENKEELQKRLREAAEKITSEIRNSSFITIDARSFTGSNEDVFEFPASAFRTLNELTDEIYFAISDHVKPFEYGYSWAIRNPENRKIIKNARMITGTKPGIPLDDERSLAEVGIRPGMVLELVHPQNS